MPAFRKTRIVCVSDTHNSTVKLPKGDVLIHAGDLTNQGSYSELSKTVKWLEEADFEAKIIIAGNHDITLDSEFYSEYGLYFHNQNPESPAKCLSLLTSSPTLTYLNHTSTTIRLSSPSGPHTTFKIFGSPHAPRQGRWAFFYDAPTFPSTLSELPGLWKCIPLDTDIVVTHTPPRTHRDETDRCRPSGCEALRQMLWRVRPRLAICGHIHEARGAERVLWDLECPNAAFAEKGVTNWSDPGAGSGNKKLSLVDLTGKTSTPFANDGSHSPVGTTSYQKPTDMASLTPSPNREPSASSHQGQNTSGTLGLGGNPSSPRCDQEALYGRLGRRETCVVNAAIMKSSYPHTGGKQYYKPIVVDLYLPVWSSEEEDG